MKVCGLTREEDVRCAVEAGAQAVGFISGFPKSPRNLSLDRAGELMRMVPPFVDRVLVTTKELLETDPQKVVQFGPSAIQVYGKVNDAARLRRLTGARLILPHLMDGSGLRRSEASGFDAVISDTFVPGQHGGTGRVSDWDACRALKEEVSPLPLILSGGLNPGNVGEAIRLVRPYAVDVSSGVESSPGIKDRSKVMEFVKAVGMA